MNSRTFEDVYVGIDLPSKGIELVGSSSRETCKDVRIPTVETILPIQFSDLKDLKPDGENGLEKPKFTGAAENVNMHYNPQTGTNFPDLGIMPILWTAATVLWDDLKLLGVAYIFYQQHFVPNAVGLAFSGMIPGVFRGRIVTKFHLKPIR
ncbi:unnamed protein product [Orchesella dallaii]|uniref:Uncharacterized protein n=1 Tax=Orchesella dallaii TaxID=48710 RepID=A0ABP1Q2B8_9HEXA